MPEVSGPMVPLDASTMERDSADYCQGCGRNQQGAGPIVRYFFPLHGVEPAECDILCFCRDCSLKISGAMEELWHQHDLNHSHSNNHYWLQRAAYLLTQATLALARMEP